MFRLQYKLQQITSASATFMSFGEWLCLEICPTDSLVLVLDKVAYHRSANIMALFALLERRVQVLWLPKYSPDMNPIERFWFHLKHNILVLGFKLKTIRLLYPRHQKPITKNLI